MTTLFLTVPSSGTNFGVRLLAGYLGLDGRNYLVGPDSTADFCHVHANKSADINIADFDAVLITLRHPLLSAQTQKSSMSRDISPIVDSWSAIIDDAGKAKKLIFLDIDCPEEERRPQLQVIADHFGKGDMTEAIDRFATDWPRLNSSINDDDRKILQFAIQKFEEYRSQ